MTLRNFSCVPVVLAAALLAACESPRAARIRERADEFAALDPFSRKLVREGMFDLGFSADAVYMALGRPNEVRKTETEDGEVETWVYRNFMYGDGQPMLIRQRQGAGNVASGRPTGRTDRSAPAAIPSGTPTPPQPTIADMASPPLATLKLELRDGRVVRAKLDI